MGQKERLSGEDFSGGELGSERIEAEGLTSSSKVHQ